MGLVSLFCSLVFLLLLFPFNFLFMTLNTLSTLFLSEYISLLNVFWLNRLYQPCRKLDLGGIWSDAFISLFMHSLIFSVSYDLSAITYSSLCFFKFLIDAIAKVVSCLGLLTACEYNINLESTSIAMCDLV